MLSTSSFYTSRLMHGYQSRGYGFPKEVILKISSFHRCMWSCRRFVLPQSTDKVREVGIWVLFGLWFMLSLQLLPIWFTKQSNIKPKTTGRKIGLKNWIISGCMLISWLNTHVFFLFFFPIVLLTNECWVVSKTWRRSPISFEHVYLWCLFFDPHQTKHQSITNV